MTTKRVRKKGAPVETPIVDQGQEVVEKPVPNVAESVKATAEKVEKAVSGAMESAVESAKAAVEKVEKAVQDNQPLSEFLDHQRKALAEAGKALEALIPSNFLEHSQAAVKEVIEGYRKLINSAIEEVGKIVDRARQVVEGEKKAEDGTNGTQPKA